MTVVDQRYGAELVTGKGKVYMFDAVECLINYKDENKLADDHFSHILVTGFSKPGKLIDATKSFYLQSRQLPSPMGMYLTAFSDRETADQFAKDFVGEIFNWQELNSNFNRLKQ